MSLETAREQILERVVLAKRIGGMYSAEAVGLIAALSLAEPYIYSADPVAQAGFERGFADAKAMLHCAETLPGADPVIAAIV